MARWFDHRCNGDWENRGWTFSNSSHRQLWEPWGDDDDNNYARCPANRGYGTVTFPIDPTTLPEGAIIDSITIYVRMKTAAGSGPRSLNVSVMSSEDMGKFTSRTVYATSAFTDYEVGTYTKDPLGNAWDIHRLNKLRLRISSLNEVLDSIRVAKAWVRVNYHLRPKVTVLSPSGTIVSPTPEITWSYSQDDAEPQAAADYKIFTQQQVGEASFNPDVSKPVLEGSIKGEATNVRTGTNFNNGEYRVYVRVKSQKGATSLWAYKSFTIAAPSPGVPGDDNAGLSGTPGVGTPTAIPDTFYSAAQLRMRDASNLMSVQQADFEIASDPLEYVGTNCTLSRSTAQAFSDGEASMKVVANAAGDLIITSTKIEIAESVPITLRAQVLAVTNGRTCQIYAQFYDELHALLSTSTPISDTDSVSTWRGLSANVSASPTGAKSMELVIKIVGAASGEVHYVDKVGVMYGTNSSWTDGGHQSRNLLSSYLATGDDPVSSTGLWEATNSATTVQRVATTGTGSHGIKTHQMTYAGVTSTISFRATGTVFTTPTSGTNFTLNKPAGVTDNDLLLAFVTSTESGEIVPPTGWTAVNKASLDDPDGDVALYVLKRTATAADPATWTDGRLSVASSRRSAVVVAYAGAANADDQFIAENVRSDASGGVLHKTQTITNVDPKAWRVAAFAASNSVAGGGFTANVTPPSTSQAPPISYVGRSPVWAGYTDNGSYTLYRPEGVRSGDLMVAAAIFAGRVLTVTAPSGWTLVRRAHQVYSSSSTGGPTSGDVTVAIFKRTAGSSEPSGWTGTHGNSAIQKITQTVAYRNCADSSQQFLAENSAGSSSGSAISTPTISNTDGRAWRVSIFGAAASQASEFHIGENVQRISDTTSVTGIDAIIGFGDSNGQVGTGSQSRTATFSKKFGPSSSFYSAIGWIGLIRPLSAPPTQGANEAERVDNTNGSPSPWLTTAVYDSNAAIPRGETAVYGSFTPGSSGAANSLVSWIGIIKPASFSVDGEARVRTNTFVDISEISEVMELVGNKLTTVSSFLGSSDGQPMLGLEFYRANQFLSSVTAPGSPFGSSVWSKAWASFTVPAGATRVRPIIAALNRNVGDTVKFDRIGILVGAPADGEEPVWRNGTARPEHPVWSKPMIQYADDIGSGYGEWRDLPGQKTVPPEFSEGTALLSYIDHSVIPLNRRKYRVQTLSYGLTGERFLSGWGPESGEVSFSALNWWLKDFKYPDRSLRAYVKAEEVSVDTTNTATTFQGLGEDYPVVLTEGYKGDTVSLTFIVGGSYGGRAAEAQLYQLLRSGRTLFLQSDQDYAWWVRPIETLSAKTLLTGRRIEDPIKEITVKFVQVKPED